MQTFAADRISNSSIFRDHKNITNSMTQDMMKLEVNIGGEEWNNSIAHFKWLTELPVLSIDSTL
jgi:hypothetical protein